MNCWDLSITKNLSVFPSDSFLTANFASLETETQQFPAKILDGRVEVVKGKNIAITNWLLLPRHDTSKEIIVKKLLKSPLTERNPA